MSPPATPAKLVLLRTAETLSIAAVGGVALAWLGFPAGLVIGALLAVAVAALAGRPVTVPAVLSRAISVLVGVFALVALALTAVGVYGVMAYSVRERTQEIGVRMALGATASSVVRLVIGQALRLVAIGVVFGLIAAALLTRLLERLLYQVDPFDPWTFAVTALVLLAVATIASYVPARRGMRVAPVEALRTN